MKKLCLIPYITSAFLLSGCGALDALGDATMQKKQLADGSPVTLGLNLVPTAEWGCNHVDTSTQYKWADLRHQAAFSLGSGESILTDKAMEYANAHGLKANYINLVVPEEKTLGTGPIQWNLRRNSKAFATYYQCEKINPQHKIGMTKKTSWGIG